MLRKIFAFIALTTLSLSACGCVALLAGAAGGAGTAIWLSGKLTQNVNVSYDRVITSTLNALEELKMPVTKQTTTAEITQIMSRYANGKTVWIDIKATSTVASSISIRVGASGDKTAERKLLDTISKYL